MPNTLPGAVRLPRFLARLLLLSLFIALPSHAGNLLTNPGFEADLAGWSDDWGNSQIDTVNVHSGAKALRIGPAAGGRAQPVYSLTPGTLYTLCAWSRMGSTSNPVYVGVDIYNSSNQRIYNDQFSPQSTIWQQDSVTFTYPTDAAFLNVWAWTDPASTATYLDDFTLVPGTSCATPPDARFSAEVTDLFVTFTDTSADDGSLTDWQWDFGDGTLSYIQHPSHGYALDGLYTVTLTVTDDDGFSDSASKTIAVGSAVEGNVVTSWVAPYAISQSMAQADADYGACSPRDGINRIGLQFWTPNSDGTIKYANHEWYTPTDGDVAWWRNWCTANGADCMLTIYNNDGSWNWDLARAAFTDNRSRFVSALVHEMVRLELDGIDIDLEGNDADLLAGDRAAFRQFIVELSAQLKPLGKLLSVNSFPYVWNAPNIDWWPDWAGYVDNIQSMGYDQLYEGATGWQTYSYQQSAAVAAGFAANDLLMGMPAWSGSHSSWGTSSGRGTSAQAHVQEVHYDLPYGATGIAIWDMQLLGWQDNSALWCEVAALKSNGSTPPPNSPPSANAGSNQNLADTDGIPGEDVSLNGGDSSDSDGSLVSYRWYWSGGSSNGVAPTIRLPDGTTVITLEVTDNEGATDTDLVTITVNPPQVITAVHIGDLDAVKNGGKKNWSSTFSVSVHSGDETGVAGATVNGVWSDGATSSTQCTTDNTGRCELYRSTTRSALTFTVSNISGAGLSYDAEANHDPDNTDSDGHSITLNKDGSTTDPGPPPEMIWVYLDNMSGSASGNKRWTATVTITIGSSQSANLSGVTASGSWSGGASGSASCVTDSAGRCSISTGSKNATATFTLGNLSGPNHTYDSAANRDDTSETVIRQ